MSVLSIIVAFIVPTILGFLVVNLFDVDKHIFTLLKIALGYMFGILFLSFLLFLLGFVGIPLNAVNIYIFIFIILGILLYLNIRYTSIHSSFHFDQIKKSNLSTKVLLLIFAVLLLIKGFFGILFVIQSPTYQDDSLDKWNMRAKVFFYRQSMVMDKGDDEYLGMLQGPYNFDKEKSIPLRPYPPANSLFKTWIAINLGYYDDELVNLVNPITFIVFTITLVLLLMLILDIKGASLGGILFLGIPYVWIHATNPYVEFFVMAYLIIITLLFIIYLDTKKESYRLLFLAFLAFLFFTKKEALIFYGIVGLTYGFNIFFKNYIGHFIDAIKKTFFLLIKDSWMIIPLVIWLYFLYKTGYINIFLNHHAGSTENYFHPEIFSIYKLVLFNQGTFGLLFFFATIASFVGYKTILKTDLKYAYFIFLGSFLLIFYTLSSTGAFVEAAQQVGINRSFIEILPLFFVLSYIALFYQEKNSIIK